MRVLAGFPSVVKPSSGDKVVRSRPLSGQQQGENVYLVKEWSEETGQWVGQSWWDEFVEEAAAFPHGSYDDRIDAASSAYIELTQDRTRGKGKITVATGTAQRLTPRGVT
jgi:predicted phage terminase large subunit-like protein